MAIEDINRPEGRRRAEENEGVYGNLSPERQVRPLKEEQLRRIASFKVKAMTAFEGNGQKVMEYKKTNPTQNAEKFANEQIKRNLGIGVLQAGGMDKSTLEIMTDEQIKVAIKNAEKTDQVEQNMDQFLKWEAEQN